MPIPVTIPSLEQRNTVADIMGKVSGAVHKRENPNAAPALAEVPIALGSSLAAPEIRPGPSNPRNDLSRRCLREVPAGSASCEGATNCSGAAVGSPFCSGGTLGAVAIVAQTDPT